MNNLKIALLQIMPGNNIEENRRIGEEACRKAKLLDADIALFPEMWSCGYSFPENVAELKELAVSTDGEFVSFFGNLAAELDMAVGITFLEKHSPQPQNTIRLFDRHGKSVLTYAKESTLRTSTWTSCETTEAAKFMETPTATRKNIRS